MPNEVDIVDTIQLNAQHLSWKWIKAHCPNCKFRLAMDIFNLIFCPMCRPEKMEICQRCKVPMWRCECKG